MSGLCYIVWHVQSCAEAFGIEGCNCGPGWWVLDAGNPMDGPHGYESQALDVAHDLNALAHDAGLLTGAT